MPTPNQDETKQEFVSRCIKVMMDEGGREQKQCIAICYSIWDRKKNVTEKIDLFLEQGTTTDDIDVTPRCSAPKRKKKDIMRRRLQTTKGIV